MEPKKFSEEDEDLKDEDFDFELPKSMTQDPISEDIKFIFSA